MKTLWLITSLIAAMALTACDTGNDSEGTGTTQGEGSGSVSDIEILPRRVSHIRIVYP